MSTRIACPNCGGEHTLRNPGITMLVCDYCHCTVYWNAQNVLSAGKQAVLPKADTRLYYGATGRIAIAPGNLRRFEVIGHVRYGYGGGRGSWDEWHLELEDGSNVWLNEDQRRLSLEQNVQLHGAPPTFHQLAPGQPMTMNGVSYTVRETREANLLGGEGQLPFVVEIGETYPYADLVTLDGTQAASLEYDADGVLFFQGRTLGHDEVQVDNENNEHARPATETEGQTVVCPECGATLKKPDGLAVETLVCKYCGTQNDLTGAEARIMGKNPDKAPAFKYEVGHAAVIDGIRYEVCGRVQIRYDAGGEAHEYLLFNAKQPYVFLANEEGDWKIERWSQAAPDRDAFSLREGDKVNVGGRTFEMTEAGSSRVGYVDGAFPWLSKTGDRSRYVDFEASDGSLYCAEHDGNEVEYFAGTEMKKKAIKAAFAAGEQGFNPNAGAQTGQTGASAAGGASPASPAKEEKPWWKFW